MVTCSSDSIPLAGRSEAGSPELGGWLLALELSALPGVLLSGQDETLGSKGAEVKSIAGATWAGGAAARRPVRCRAGPPALRI